jgi:hypothetical protein
MLQGVEKCQSCEQETLAYQLVQNDLVQGRMEVQQARVDAKTRVQEAGLR